MWHRIIEVPPFLLCTEMLRWTPLLLDWWEKNDIFNEISGDLKPQMGFYISFNVYHHRLRQICACCSWIPRLSLFPSKVGSFCFWITELNRILIWWKYKDHPKSIVHPTKIFFILATNVNLIVPFWEKVREGPISVGIILWESYLSVWRIHERAFTGCINVYLLLCTNHDWTKFPDYNIWCNIDDY